MNNAEHHDFGVVVIGRNEGARLRACLTRLAQSSLPIVYVDSASTDGSASLARNLGITTLELDGRQPLSAARGRNAGFYYLLEHYPKLMFIQFVDGDCVLNSEWLDYANEQLQTEPTFVAACGILREKNHHASLFSQLSDIDWSYRPIGEIRNCGGIFMVRVSTFQQINGFRSDLSGEEEAELCRRLQRTGGKIVRFPVAMAEHDAGEQNLAQWWQRTTRVGYSYAEAAALPEPNRDHHKQRVISANIIWAALIPITIIGLLATHWIWSPYAVAIATLLLLLYPIQIIRISRRAKSDGLTTSRAWLYGSFCMLAKWPQLVGHLRYWFNR